MSTDTAVSVLLVDDSPVVRGLVERGLSEDRDIKVIGSAGNGQVALDFVRRTPPDVVLLDVEMPVMDGLSALPKILECAPSTAVIMASALTLRHAGLSFRALQLGAADYVPKPDARGGANALPEFFLELRTKVKAHGRKRAASTPAVTRPPGLKLLKPSAVAIASSTGGPPALMKVFSRLKGGLPPPIFVTQHMPPTFTAMLAEQIGRTSGMSACEAMHGMTVARGHVYVAPGGSHMLVGRRGDVVTIELSDGPAENFVKPAADPMFRSLAAAYGPGLLACVLTGMGADGAEGCKSIAQAGGHFFVQDEPTSVVWGMPGAAWRTGRAMAQVPLDAIGPYLAQAMGITA